MLCNNCFHRDKQFFRIGKYQEVEIEIWRCALFHVTVFKRVTSRGRIKFVTQKGKHVVICTEHSKFPRTSEKFKQWRRMGIKFRKPWRLMS